MVRNDDKLNDKCTGGQSVSLCHPVYSPPGNGDVVMYRSAYLTTLPSSPEFGCDVTLTRAEIPPRVVQLSHRFACISSAIPTLLWFLDVHMDSRTQRVGRLEDAQIGLNFPNPHSFSIPTCPSKMHIAQVEFPGVALKSIACVTPSLLSIPLQGRHGSSANHPLYPSIFARCFMDTIQYFRSTKSITEIVS